MRIGLAFECLNREGDIVQMLGNALSNMAAVALGAKVQNHAGPNLPFCSFAIITQENAERTKARPALPCTQDHRSRRFFAKRGSLVKRLAQYARHDAIRLYCFE